MLHDQTLIVEMTGIVGAGFLPGLLDAVCLTLRASYHRLDQDGNPAPLRTRFVIDNTIARSADPARRERINQLINAETRSDAERAELNAQLRWVDGNVMRSLDRVRFPIDLVLRRGGRLQSHIHLIDSDWVETDIYDGFSEPRLQIFLRADQNAVAQSFERNEALKALLYSDPKAFCETPERALDLQDEWHRRVRRLRGLLTIIRVRPDNETDAVHDFAITIAEELVKPLNIFGLSLKKRDEYDLAISFAGEDRAVAEAIAVELRRLGAHVFYDIFERAELWGKDLYAHLSEIYFKRARYCLLIASRHYATKLWTTHELRAAQARAFGQNEEYILPLRIDNTEIPGLLPTIGYVYLEDGSVAPVVDLLVKKLGLSRRR